MKVLVGEFSSYKAIVISRFLKLNYKNIDIYTYDSRKFTKIIKSKYTNKHFIVNPNHFEEQLQSIIIDNKVDFFFPVINNSLTKIWENKHKYGNSLNYLGEISSYKVLNDKLLLYDLAKSLKIPVPLKYESVEDAIIPFIIKPTNLSSSKGLVYVNDEKDIPVQLQSDNLIIQQFVEGIGAGYSFYCKNGKICDGYGHKRLGEYPISGGSSTYRTNYVDNRMVEIAKKIVRHLNYTGFAMFEYKLTKNNELYLLEVNPRIWGSIHQGMANGTNYFEHILGKSLNYNKHDNNLDTYIAPLIYLSLFKYLFHFEFTPIRLFVSNWFKNLPDVSLFKDFNGYLSTILRKLL